MDLAEARALLDKVVEDRRARSVTYLPGPRTFPVGRAEGCLVYDDYGSAYLDFGPGGEVNILGHRNPQVVHAITDHLVHYTYTGEDHLSRFAIEYAEALSKTLPPDQDGNPYQVLVLPSVTQADALIRSLPGTVWDDTVAGFGRTGTMWGFERTAGVPDTLIVGSEGGGGLPFAALVSTRRVMETIPCLPFMSAHPVVCAAASAVLAQITPELLAHVGAMGEVLSGGLAELSKQFPDIIVPAAPAPGLLQKVPLHYSISVETFVRSCRDKGLLMHSDLHLTPPLVVTEQEVRQAIDVLGDVCLDWS